MANIGRKILSAFVEVIEKEIPGTRHEEITTRPPIIANGNQAVNIAITEKFKQYFEKLFKDANMPGPDYFEFSKMTEAMQSIPDEKARYAAAFAGLSVQGLDRQKLLSSAMQYAEILQTDANNFNATIDAALKEKVQSRQQEIENNAKRVEALAKEISDLQNKITVLQNEIKENEEKIENNSGAYKREFQMMKEKIEKDMDKIKQYL